MSKLVYLDYNATTPLAPEVLDAMLPFLREEFGNPSSIHGFGRNAKAALLHARERVAAFLGSSANEIVFTASGTESDNLAILGALAAHEDASAKAKGANAPTRRHLVASAIEHHAVLHTMKNLEAKGYPVTFVPVDRSGRVTVQALAEAVRPDTLLVSVMFANNETGVVQPIRALSDVAHRVGALVHTDAVQACGKIPVDVNELGVDLLSLSAHKFYGPKGVGALYVRNGTPVKSVFRGGGQERSRRPGTENVSGVVGLAEAATRAQERLVEESSRLRALRDALQNDLLSGIDGCHVNGEGAERTPNTLNVRFEDVDGEDLVHALDRAGFAVSTGAACSSGAVAPSHVLVAMGLTPREVQGSVRVSLGRGTERIHTEEFSRALRRLVDQSRARYRAETAPV